MGEDADAQRTTDAPSTPERSRTDDPLVWSLTKTWMNRCIGEHPECRRYLEDNAQIWYPTRLIDVGHPKCLDTSAVRLHDTRNSPAQGPYACLSHCWGGKVPLMLIESNEQEFLKGISLHDLPRSFADAVQVARQLGIQYLWIDSLCIIQDSNADWAAEAACMGQVYENSFLNIATVGADNPNGGCFFERDHASIRQVLVHIDWEDRNGEHEEGERVCLDAGLWTDLDKANLNQRAWVLQERVLAPRQIHFGRQQVIWECRSQAASEIFPSGIPGLFASPYDEDYNRSPICHELKWFATVLESIRQLRASKDESESQEHRNRLSSLYRDVFYCWSVISERYTECGLTFARDKLIAISGLAKAMESVLQDKYLAGLWRSRIHEHLLWEVVETTTRRPRPLRGPSWSWVCADGAVSQYRPSYFSETEDPLQFGELLNASVDEVNDEDRPEIICKGVLRMKCRLYPARLTIPSLPPRRADVNISIGDMNLDDQTILDDLQDIVSTELDLFFMPCRLKIEKAEDGKPHVYGLLLMPTGRVDGQFERFGTLFAHIESTDVEVFGRLWPKLSELKYEKVLGQDWLAISIV